MQIEDIAWIRLPTRRPVQEERQFAVGARVRGQVVIDDEHIAAGPHPAFGQRAAGKRGDVLETGHRGRLGDDDAGEFEGCGLAQRLDRRHDRRTLLADQHVDADHVAPLLREDGIQRERAFPAAGVANDQLALALADGHHRIDHLPAGHQRPIHEVARDDRWRTGLERAARDRRDRRPAVQRHSQRIDDAPEKRVADADGERLAGQVGGRARIQAAALAEQDGADAFAPEVKDQPATAIFKVEHFIHRRRGQSLDPDDAVADRDDPALLGDA